MAWTLPYFYFQFLLHVRGATEIAGVALETLLTFLAGCIILFLIGIGVRRFVLLLYGTRATVDWRSTPVLPSHK
jgi:hypothetical protein